MWHGVVFNCESGQAVQAIGSIFERQGLSVIRSFDLRAALSKQAGCACPYHGSAGCGCQFAVLLVYGEQVGPATLTIHGENQRTAAQISCSPAALPDPRLVKAVMAALYEAVLIAPNGLVGEVTADAPQ